MQQWADARRADPRDPVTVARSLELQAREIQGQIKGLYAKPATVDEVEANISSSVYAEHERFAKESGRGVVEAFGGALMMARDGTTRMQKPRLYDPPSPLTWRSMAALFPEETVRAYSRIARESIGDEGIQMAVRESRLAALTEQLRSLEDQHEAVVDEAGRHGVTLAHLPNVQKRREAAAARAQVDSHAREVRRQQEAVLNERQPARQSEYLRDR